MTLSVHHGNNLCTFLIAMTANHLAKIIKALPVSGGIRDCPITFSLLFSQTSYSSRFVQESMLLPISASHPLALVTGVLWALDAF